MPAELSPCGDSSTRLVIIRGNSGSGKSTVAQLVRERAGRNCALIGQDHFRRIVLWEQDKTGGLIADYLEDNVRWLVDRGRDVILEGILWTGKYRPMLLRLLDSHEGCSSVFYLDVSFEETTRRHTTRPMAGFTVEQMADWYNPYDILGVPGERVIGESSTQEQTVNLIGQLSGLFSPGVSAEVKERDSARSLTG
ncbi:AAA family ATPase [Catelliglobosispora koreensis]|uniref:AAA family ATPase n=1 Tax=Catelliglobosispora koreensis TaxID=129052 RepID=UPI00036DCB85|nr:AAA family ATPase [Catelliglobosispora koreensis]